MTSIAYLALGSNIDPKTTYLKEAIHSLHQQADISVRQQSEVYQTPPVGYADQDDFLNMTVEVATTLPPHDLLEACQAIEQQLKRVRTIKNGPRTIDLDLLLYDDQELDSDQLVVPHPRMHQRAFVLVPLTEIASQVEISGTGRTVGQWKSQLAAEDQAAIRSLGPLDALVE